MIRRGILEQPGISISEYRATVCPQNAPIDNRPGDATLGA